MGQINGKNSKVLGDGKKPQRAYFKKKKVKNAQNRKTAVEVSQGKCLDCGSGNQVSAHHIMFKSEVGVDDSFDNLIPLCFNCHRKAHDGYYIKPRHPEETQSVYVTAKEYIISLLERLDLKLYREKIEQRRRA